MDNKPKYALGLDYGTNSVRALIVDVKTGREVGTAVHNYESGEAGIILDKSDPNLARQNPAEYVKGIEITVKQAVAAARRANKRFDAADIIGIGIDTTGSTPLPVDREGTPLAMKKEFKKNPNAMAWLWKDHTSHAEAAEITALAAKEHPEYLAKCGGTYSSEWFFSKILHCLRTDPAVFDAAWSWVECCDYVPGVLTGAAKPELLKRSRCASGHKAMFNDAWGGLPSKEFLSKLNPKLGALRDRLYSKTYAVDVTSGGLTAEWAKKLGLKAGIPVAVGAFDAHLGAVGSGVQKGKIVKIIGTSTCDICVCPAGDGMPDVPGVCGIVDGSVLPGYLGLEAGQSAVGDIFNWFVNEIQPGGPKKGSHETLTKKGGQAPARPIRAPGPRLEQRQPDDPGRPAAHGPARRHDAPDPTRGDLPGPHRGDGLRRPDHHQEVRGIRDRDRRDHQLRRHRREERPRHADLRRHHRKGNEGGQVGPNLRPRLGHGRGRGRRQGQRRSRNVRRGPGGYGRSQAPDVQARS
jgi:L-ribulokinase